MTDVEEIKRKFLVDVADHQIYVLLDNGVYRHLRFRADSSVYWFDLITWPGCLTINGDMGTYVFSRLEDMFQFFRTDRDYGGSLYIRLSYWAEKVRADDVHSPVREYSPEVFRAAVMNRIQDDENVTPEIREGIELEVLKKADDGQYAAMEAAVNFEHDDFRLTDFWEVNITDYTWHFVWCCFAIAWGIEKYDAMKETENAA